MLKPFRSLTSQDLGSAAAAAHWQSTKERTRKKKKFAAAAAVIGAAKAFDMGAACLVLVGPNLRRKA